MDIRTNREDFAVEIEDLARAFQYEGRIEHNETFLDGQITNTFVLTEGEKKGDYRQTFACPENLSPLKQKSFLKRELKVGLYDALHDMTRRELPWGSLTGVRPTKFARTLIEDGYAREHTIAETLAKNYRVRKDKAKLVAEILKNQKCIIRNDKLVDLYVNIPVCPTRCSYCSFISSELGAVKKELDAYLQNLHREIEAVKKMIFSRAYIVRTIYIGGGTPSVLSEGQLDDLLSALTFPVSEFTVECGRPDTITRGKLEVLKKHNVSRISINPQTFCESTLKRIGRKTKNKEVIEAYQMALELGLGVNMDIIAGLPGEKLGIFKRTISTLLDLAPENITVHTLSVKNGAQIKEEGQSLDNRDIEKMVDYARDALSKAGYKPYYLYRQKNQLGALENTGYFRDGNICIFNIDSMEETNSVIALGAGAISKRVYSSENRLERLPNAKFLQDYNARIDEIISKKVNFFS